MITDPKQLTVGDTIYYAQAFSDPKKYNSCIIYTYKVIQFPITSNPSNMTNFIKLEDSSQQWIKINLNTNEWSYKKVVSINQYDERSMQDMGIIPNVYNRHNAFWTMSEAKSYMCRVTRLSITEPKGHYTNNYDRAMKVLDLD